MQQPLFEVHWTERALERMRRLYDWVTEHDCEENAASLVERLFEAGDGLVWSPQRYESAPEWGEGVRRLPLRGGASMQQPLFEVHWTERALERILFKVDEAQRRVDIVTVMGGRENPREVR